jgi:hypothetical protein
MMIATDARYFALRSIADQYRASGAGARLFSPGELTADERAEATTAIAASEEAARIANARHEAGHAVVGCVTGLVIESVSIDPRWVKQRCGGIVYEAGRVKWTVAPCSDMEMAIVLAAGPLAQEELTGELSLPVFNGSDMHLMQRLLVEKSHRDFAFASARELIRIHHSAIVRLADDLLARVTLTGRDVLDTVVGRACARPSTLRNSRRRGSDLSKASRMTRRSPISPRASPSSSRRNTCAPRRAERLGRPFARSAAT